MARMEKLKKSDVNFFKSETQTTQSKHKPPILKPNPPPIPSPNLYSPIKNVPILPIYTLSFVPSLPGAIITCTSFKGNRLTIPNSYNHLYIKFV